MTRDEVVASVAAPAEHYTGPIRAALPAARARLAECSAGDAVGYLGRCLAPLLVRFGDPRGQLSVDEVADLIALPTT